MNVSPVSSSSRRCMYCWRRIVGPRSMLMNWGASTFPTSFSGRASSAGVASRTASRVKMSFVFMDPHLKVNG